MNIDNMLLSETEIRTYIYEEIPGISYDDMWKIRNRLVYDSIPLSVAVNEYKIELQFKEWNKSKNKKYYSVPMLNGGRKIVYMCKEQVEFLYDGKDYIEA